MTNQNKNLKRNYNKVDKPRHNHHSKVKILNEASTLLTNLHSNTETKGETYKHPFSTFVTMQIDIVHEQVHNHNKKLTCNTKVSRHANKFPIIQNLALSKCTNKFTSISIDIVVLLYRLIFALQVIWITQFQILIIQSVLIMQIFSIDHC